ncbi:MAG TPA: class I SAM-dependent methyltransferase [Spirochaetota bacterium]|nr:class I SAM-dependent methyltransferase [Spirochaetota bacterium]HPR49934.1 class I SAM-dependent methyltransferase [Spirochaetota bacterium]
MKQSDFFSGKQQAKYLNNNPLARLLVQNFFSGIAELLQRTGRPGNVLEIGCGEGHVTDIITGTFTQSSIVITDIAEKMVEITKTRINKQENMQYRVADAENLSFNSSSFDCIVICEVLEHVQDPYKVLSQIHDILHDGGYVLFSVPREPLWRILNVIRLKYIKRLGNTFGHINHWSRKGFFLFVEEKFDIIDYRLPLPWTIVLARKRNSFS